eukprot:COSAG04_NODE_21971_length_363_cov_3.121212_2_plen_28_part_01
MIKRFICRFSFAFSCAVVDQARQTRARA